MELFMHLWSSTRGPITRGMHKKIQLDFIQDGSNLHGLLTLFNGRKKISRFEEVYQRAVE